jgi:hypothetical protein
MRRTAGEPPVNSSSLELAPQVHEQRHACAVDHLDRAVVDLNALLVANPVEQLAHALPERRRLRDGDLAAQIDANAIGHLGRPPSELG